MSPHRTLAASRSTCVDTRRPPSRWLLLFALAGVACADVEVRTDAVVSADAVVSPDATAPDASDPNERPLSVT